ncbi:unnamed protein product [Alternaria alternata]
MSASLSSITSGETQPTPTACSPNIAPNGINVTGLVGQICQVNVPPSEVNITSCCDSGAEWTLSNRRGRRDSNRILNGYWGNADNIYFRGNVPVYRRSVGFHDWVRRWS